MTDTLVFSNISNDCTHLLILKPSLIIQSTSFGLKLLQGCAMYSIFLLHRNVYESIYLSLSICSFEFQYSINTKAEIDIILLQYSGLQCSQHSYISYIVFLFL